MDPKPNTVGSNEARRRGVARAISSTRSGWQVDETSSPSRMVAVAATESTSGFGSVDGEKEDYAGTAGYKPGHLRHLAIGSKSLKGVRQTPAGPENDDSSSGYVAVSPSSSPSSSALLRRNKTTALSPAPAVTPAPKATPRSVGKSPFAEGPTSSAIAKPKRRIAPASKRESMTPLRIPDDDDVRRQVNMPNDDGNDGGGGGWGWGSWADNLANKVAGLFVEECKPPEPVETRVPAEVTVAKTNSNSSLDSPSSTAQGVAIISEGTLAVATAIEDALTRITFRTTELAASALRQVGVGEVTAQSALSRLKEENDAIRSSLSASREVARAMATKTRATQMELDRCREALDAAKGQVAFLEEDNRRLQDGIAHGHNNGELANDQIRKQIEALLNEKAKLQADNARLNRENERLMALVQYHETKNFCYPPQSDDCYSPRSTDSDYYGNGNVYSVGQDGVQENGQGNEDRLHGADSPASTGECGVKSDEKAVVDTIDSIPVNGSVEDAQSISRTRSPVNRSQIQVPEADG